MTRQTSIEWLIEQCPRIETIVSNSVLEQAKEMHKQEIITASNGYTTTELLGVTKGEYYYQETFGSKDINGNEIQFIKVVEQQLPQQEISDEEIEKEISKRYMHPTQDYAFRDACKWYREQLKQL